jgi:hypothetical protein
MPEYFRPAAENGYHMSNAPDAVAAPPIDALIGEMIATLALAANAHLEPTSGQPDLEAAALACDVAGAAFERISPRLRPEDRTGLAGLLTQTRMSIVRKRG